MTIPQIVSLICWGIFLFYWFINWSKVKPTLEKKGFNTDKLRYIILGIIALLLINQFVLHNMLHVPSCQWDWSGCHSHRFSLVNAQPLPIQIMGVLLDILGIAIAVVARRTLAGNWSSTLDVKKGHELVTTGIYHSIRHPIYTGVLIMLFATFLAFESAPEFIVLLVVTITFLVRIKKEEDLMTKTFPKEYPEYKKRTKALIPFIW